MFEGLRKKIVSVVKKFSEKEEKELEEPTPLKKEEVKENLNANQTKVDAQYSDLKVIQDDTKSHHLKEINEHKKDVETNEAQDRNVSQNNKIPASNSHAQAIDQDIKPQEIIHKKMPPYVNNEAVTPPKQIEQTKTKEIVNEHEKVQLGEGIGLKLGLSTKIKGVVFRKIRLKEGEVDDFIENLKISMLESDVAYNTTEDFSKDLKNKLLNSEINSKEVEKAIINIVREALLDIISSVQGVDFLPFIKQKVSEARPVKILFLGPNGTGKTTSIAKITYLLKSNGLHAVISASDTFRAAAIEQSEHHAKKLGVPVIKGSYGSDPASIAFNAIDFARARGLDVVLVDSAGRQETNKNLIKEIEKMYRVVNPDLVLYVGESTAGNAIAQQIYEFKTHVKIDGIILTKLDCDARGGSAISIARETQTPILFFGTGEAYTDLVPYSPTFILDAILSNN